MTARSRLTGERRRRSGDGGAETEEAETEEAETEGAETEGEDTEGADTEGAETKGAETKGRGGAEDEHESASREDARDEHRTCRAAQEPQPRLRRVAADGGKASEAKRNAEPQRDAAQPKEKQRGVDSGGQKGAGAGST